MAAVMTHVERFRAVMGFHEVDRLPRIEWASWWGQTLERWYGEWLPRELKDGNAIRAYMGLDPYWQHWIRAVGPTMPPEASHGAGLLPRPEDYGAYKKHLFPAPAGLVEQLAKSGAAQAKGEALVWITLEGFFWFPRMLFGIERHLYAFYDYADLMHTINQDLVKYHLAVLEAIDPVCRPTFMTFAEDLSYNHGPMLSKEQFDEFLAPYYRQVVGVLKEKGIFPVVDSDGDVTQMVPWYKEVGIECILPLERQAGVDAAKLRAAYPTFRMLGHFDKMTMPLGEEAMRGEFERLLPTMRKGGFIVSVDHQTPPGVSLEQYRVYLRLLNEYTERAAR